MGLVVGFKLRLWGGASLAAEAAGAMRFLGELSQAERRHRHRASERDVVDVVIHCTVVINLKGGLSAQIYRVLTRRYHA